MRRALLVLLIVAALVAGAAWWGYARLRWPIAQAPLELVVEQGANARSLGASLARQGLSIPGPAFELAARLRGDAGRLRAGSFEIGSAPTLAELLDLLVEGAMAQRQVRFIEGWTFRQVREALAAQPRLKQQAATLTDAELLAHLGATAPSPEGLFFPDTYAFTPGSSDLRVLERAFRRQQRLLEQQWAARSPGLPLATPYEALVLASIVEKETGRPEDRSLVAAVFLNRLKAGMRLQSDPTTIYGLGAGFDGNLRRRDLQADTPFNTYVRPGLPPTPIAMPGLASLQAVLHPAQSRALYFVARGDGSSHFSETLDAHNRAVERYQRNPERR